MEIRQGQRHRFTGYGNFILYGQSGSGKTYSAVTLPGKTLILSAEKGLRTLAELAPDMDVADINSMADMREAAALLMQPGHGYDTVFIDSLSELGEMALAEAKALTKDGRQAYMLMADTIAGVIKTFNALPLTVIMVAQEERVAAETIGPPVRAGSTGQGVRRACPYKLDFVFCLRARINDEGVERAFQRAEWRLSRQEPLNDCKHSRRPTGRIFFNN